MFEAHVHDIEPTVDIDMCCTAAKPQKSQVLLFFPEIFKNAKDRGLEPALNQNQGWERRKINGIKNDGSGDGGVCVS